MIASTSHDMRTPLNTIIAMHTLIEDNPSNEKSKRYLSIAKISSKILLFLVDDTLDYYSIKSFKFVKKIEESSIYEMIQNAFSIISIQMELKNI